MWRCRLPAVSLSRRLPCCWPRSFSFFLPPTSSISTSGWPLRLSQSLLIVTWRNSMLLPHFAAVWEQRQEQSWYSVMFKISKALFLWICLQEKILNDPPFRNSGKMYEIQHLQSCSCNFAQLVDRQRLLSTSKSSLTPGFCYYCDFAKDFGSEILN